MYTRECQELASNGCVVIPGVLSPETVISLRRELEVAVNEDLSQYPDRFDAGMVHNCMFRGREMASLLNNKTLNQFLELALCKNCIVYAYQSSSLEPSSKNFGSRVHVDSPRFIEGYETNIGVIFPLDEFTEQNGATYYLEGSHRYEQLPSESEFYSRAKRILCSAGDMIVFSGRLAHAAGENQTTQTRHALTINLCRPYMRQRFNFPDMASEADLQYLDDNGRRMLGMNVRMPKSLEEFYLPPSQRPYQPGQE